MAAARTSHIRAMLMQAVDACDKAERISASKGTRNEVERLLRGAAVNARHAAAEIEDERFRQTYGESGYRP